MTNRWQTRFSAVCVLGLMGLGAGACAAPEEGTFAEAPEETQGAAQEVQFSVSSRSARRTPAELGRELEERSIVGGGHGTCNQNDPWEKNNKRATASTLGYQYIWDSEPECWDWEWCDENGCHTETECYEASSAYTSVDNATICKKDEDWYFLPTASLPFPVSYLRLRAFAAGASYCPFYDYGNGEGTYGYDPPAAPENTLTVEVYSAQTLALVASSTSPIGRVWMDLGNTANLSNDLYFRFRGPKEANYSYHFSLGPQTDWFEDECEY